MADLVSQPTSIQSIYSWYREDKMFVNRKYQRKLVWTLEEKQRLVESIIKKYPIPAILIAERGDSSGSYEIIDGLQRLHAIVSFVETGFSTLDGKYFALDHFTTANAYLKTGKFEDNADGGPRISPKEVSTILDYSLALSVMRNATEAEINDVFDRINTYGHRLSDQERRQAGVQNAFSTMIRNAACVLRGDSSAEVLPLYSMPSISIDLPKSKHGYEVQADEVFWVQQGILRSTDLRDSMDEQCIADIAACIVGQDLIERSKDALDEIYSEENPASDRILSALEIYGSEKFQDEFNYCVQEIIKVCDTDPPKKLRDIIFSKKRTTNPFPSVFAAVIIAIHEIFIKEKKRISDYDGLRKSLIDLSDRIDTSRKATSMEERRKNIDSIKGVISSYFVKSKDNDTRIYENHTVIDIDAVIRRSEIELASYELKQGCLKLEFKGGIDGGIFAKVINTICAIANNGPNSFGKILIGVTDKSPDAKRAKEVDGIEPRKVGKRHVVGVNREAKRLKISVEQYFAKWKDAIKNSKLSAALKASCLSGLDYNSYYDLGVIVISIPPQKELSYIGDDVYWRKGDATEKATSNKEIAMLAKRF
jgi:hypothetical protein